MCCTAFAYPVFEEYQYGTGHDLSSHEGDSFDNGSYQPVAASRIGVHELGGHEDEHVDYYVCRKENTQKLYTKWPRKLVSRFEKYFKPITKIVINFCVHFLSTYGKKTKH